MKLTFIRTALVVSIAAFSGASVAAETWTLKYGHTTAGSDISDDHIGAVWLKSYLERNSAGRVKVEIYPAAQLGDFRQMLEQVQLGTLEMTQSTGGGIASFFPEIQALDIPYMIPNDMVASALADSVFMDKVREEVLKRTGNIRLVAVANTGNWRNFVTTKPVPHTADLTGLRIRTIDSPLQIEFTKALGANPTPLPWGELYTALSTGVVDGTKNSMADVMRFKLGEVLKHALLDQHSFLFGFFWMSDRWLQSLPPDLQTLVINGVRQAASIQARINERDESIYSQAFEEAGGKIYVPDGSDKAAFGNAQQAALAWYTELYGDVWVKELKQSIANAEREIEQEAQRIGGR